MPVSQSMSSGTGAGVVFTAIRLARARRLVHFSGMVATDEALFGQAHVREQLQRPINGGQAYARPVGLCPMKDALGIQVAVGLLQDLQDQPALTGQPLALRAQMILEFGTNFRHNAPPSFSHSLRFEGGQEAAFVFHWHCSSVKIRDETPRPLAVSFPLLSELLAQQSLFVFDPEQENTKEWDAGRQADPRAKQDG